MTEMQKQPGSEAGICSSRLGGQMAAAMSTNSSYIAARAWRRRRIKKARIWAAIKLIGVETQTIVSAVPEVIKPADDQKIMHSLRAMLSAGCCKKLGETFQSKSYER